MEIINCVDLAKTVETSLSDTPQINEISFTILYTTEAPATLSYINNKKKKAAQLGIKAVSIFVNEEELPKYVEALNVDPHCHGIIIQLPLMSKNQLEMIKLIDPKKDVDGLHPLNMGLLSYGDIKNCFIPCTALGCLHVILKALDLKVEKVDSNIFDLAKKALGGLSILIVGRSNIVGKPLSYLLTSCNATVTLAHSYTKDLETLTKKADIVVLATGAPKYFTQRFFNQNSIVIDVGISYIDNKICGDADIENLNVKAITPVPKGIGPMTVIYLLNNVVKAYKLQKNLGHNNQ